MRLAWARRIAELQGLPLATVLTWERTPFLEAMAQVMVAQAEADAGAAFRHERALPTGDDAYACAARAIHRAIVTADQARKKAENDAAFAELMAQGAFGG